MKTICLIGLIGLTKLVVTFGFFLYFYIYIMPIFRSPKMETTTTTVHRGITYESVNGVIPLSSLSLETVFSCSMEIPGTQFSLKKETMYMHTNIRMKDRKVAGGSRACSQGVEAVIVFLGLVIRYLDWSVGTFE